jgi:hypothetical protein
VELSAVGTAVGFGACIVVIAITIHRQRRFEATDVGSFVAAFLTGTNVPPALFLCTYAFFPDPVAVHTKLHGLEKYVSFAGLALLLVSLVSLWAVCKKAYDVTPR